MELAGTSVTVPDLKYIDRLEIHSLEEGNGVLLTNIELEFCPVGMAHWMNTFILSFSETSALLQD